MMKPAPTYFLAARLRQALGSAPSRRARARKRSRAFPTIDRLEDRIVLSWPTVAQALSGTSNTILAGTVYDDLDSNGVRSTGEDGIRGWQVYLDLDHSGTRNTDADGVLEPLATTDSNGDYRFNRLRPDTYRVNEVVPAGWTATSPVSQDVAVTLNATSRADFFAFSGGDIAGVVWNDLNADGTRDTDPGTGAFTEPGLAGWTVFLDSNNDRLLDAGEPSTTTDALGNYAFRNLPEGDYEVTEILPDGWEISPHFDTRQTATVRRQTTVFQDFANFSLTSGSLSGLVWNDLNSDGVRDTDPDTGEFTEPGLADWTIFIDLDRSGTLDAGEPSTTTDGSGHYSFVSLAEGTL